jgi:hypothetical protein
LLVVGGAAARPSSTRATTVHVTAKDFSFALSTKTVHHGPVIFVIRNDGKASHDFTIAGHTSASIAYEKTARLTVTVKRPVAKRSYCDAGLWQLAVAARSGLSSHGPGSAGLRVFGSGPRRRERVSSLIRSPYSSPPASAGSMAADAERA